MKEIPQTYPFYLYDVPIHSEIKSLILEGIKSMGTRSVTTAGQQISNTDWYLSERYPRPYFEYLKLVTDVHLNLIMQATDFCNADIELKLLNYWFQQYEESDRHSWHIHEYSVFSNVYYVDLPNGAAKTTFKVSGKEFEVEVAEGQILTFPSCFQHCSKPNKVGTKTVISFNY
jgi:mannose-6-phosphate isomerase-like protein (cupin superfamily)